jgi:hypothetical protein
VIEWLMIGGPQHGRWRLASSKPYAVPRPGPADYAVTHTGDNDAWEVRVAVATLPRPILYYPERVALPGWRVHLWAYVEVGIAAGARNPETGSTLPGCVVGVRREQEVACRWCYGRPMGGMDVCSRTGCISNVWAIEALNRLTADDAAGWSPDQPC